MTNETNTTYKRNPKWSRDEIIVTLDFYFRHYPKIPEKNSDQIIELSELLRPLTDRIGDELTINKSH